MPGDEEGHDRYFVAFSTDSCPSNQDDVAGRTAVAANSADRQNSAGRGSGQAAQLRRPRLPPPSRLRQPGRRWSQGRFILPHPTLIPLLFDRFQDVRRKDLYGSIHAFFWSELAVKRIKDQKMLTRLFNSRMSSGRLDSL